MLTGKVIEPTFYSALMRVIREAGGTAVEQVKYNSVPDIVFQLNDHTWILSVKIGEDIGTMKQALLQYLRHKEESRIPLGMVLLLPESARKIEVSEEAIEAAVRSEVPTVLIDAGPVKEQMRDRPFPEIIDFLKTTILVRLARQHHTYYPLPLVISLLEEQVSEMMAEIALEESVILDIVTDRELLSDLGHLRPNQVESVARFLASYILMSQLLFLRLFASGHPSLFAGPWSPISHSKLRRAFRKVLEINYRPIYAVDVLDSIPAEFLEDTFDLIWGLEIERARYELPGRIFHQLMPREIRKMLAAFYTRPTAADLLADLAIDHSGASVFDPACGSGTILVSAYRRKRELLEAEGKAGNAHKRFCEEEIFGADIMPFSVHLTSANLAAMDVATSIDRTQIVQGDSLKLESGRWVSPGIRQLGMFHLASGPRNGETVKGDTYDVPLDKVTTVLMNPPFTKVERGIAQFVDMKRFREQVGGEVGLWGHFVALTDSFLEDGGTFGGGVIPINVLRGRESDKVRRILFAEWTPLYVLKCTRNYGFSEWAEYRDVLLVGRKETPPADHTVKFCLVKKDLTRISLDDARSIAESVKSHDHLRSVDLDIESQPLAETKDHFTNMMWLCSTTDFGHRDALLRFFDTCSPRLRSLSQAQVATGYRCEGGSSDILFLTRGGHQSRVQQAFLRFESEGSSSVSAQTPLGVSYDIERAALTASLRTPVGVDTMDITDVADYVAHEAYGELDRVARAAGFERGEDFEWDAFWTDVNSRIQTVRTRLAVARRLNPFSPATCLVGFCSARSFSPSDQLNTISLDDPHAAAVCALLNSLVFFAQLFLSMEESTGRYIDIRLYDLLEMRLLPDEDALAALADLLHAYRHVRFPGLRHQFDANFDLRYTEFWERHRQPAHQARLWTTLDRPVQPWPPRLQFDLEVCRALGAPVSRDELVQLYGMLVEDMIIIRGLKKD
jgi:hypothetical protein